MFRFSQRTLWLLPVWLCALFPVLVLLGFLASWSAAGFRLSFAILLLVQLCVLALPFVLLSDRVRRNPPRLLRRFYAPPVPAEVPASPSTHLPPKLYPGLFERGEVVLAELDVCVLSLGCISDEGTFSVRADISALPVHRVGPMMAALLAGEPVTAEVGGSPTEVLLTHRHLSLRAPVLRFLVGRELV